MILQEWLERMKLICIFLISAQTLIHFRARGTYVKYLRLLVGMIVLILLMEPLGFFLGLLEAGEIERRIEEIFMYG